jgi:N utilization substance protein A
MEKIVDMIQSIAYDRGLEVDKVKNMIEGVMLDMLKFTLGEDLHFEVDINDKTRKISLYQKISVLDNIKEKYEPYEISIKEAIKIDPEIKVGDYLDYEVDVEKLGRMASNFVYETLEDRMKELLDDKILKEFSSKINTVVSASVARVDTRENTFLEIDDTEVMILQRNRIKGEKFKVGDTVSALVKSVEKSRYGVDIKLTRTAPKFLEELVRIEVPEVQDGAVEIMGCSRIPGKRSKLAIKAVGDVDPIGSIVGVKGIRIKAVGNALNGEAIDCIEYSEQEEMFISRALSPAIVKMVTINQEEKTAEVFISPEEKSKAIGASGINIRLASMLTGYEININDNVEEAPNVSVDKLADLFN